MNNIRKVKKLINRRFKEIQFKDLKDGDVFKLYDDNELVKDREGHSKFLAISNVFKNEDGILTINTIPTDKRWTETVESVILYRRKKRRNHNGK